MALGKNIKGITIEFGGNTTKLDSALQKVKSKSKDVGSALREINKSLKFNPGNTELLAQKQKALAEKVANTTEKLKLLQQAQEKAKTVLTDDDNGRAEFDALRREIIQTESQLKRFTSEYERLGSVKLTALGENLQNIGGKMETAGRKIMPLSAAFIGIGYAAGRAAIDFETAWAGVTKTVEGTPQQLEKIRQGILDLSKETSSSATDIAAIAEAAGQLGIATDDVLEFTKIMVQLGDTTNLTSEEAASALAKYANITGLTADNYSRLGSVIVDLGNNFATTEADIVNFAMRIAGSGKQIGFTDQQIMALSASLSSVGLEAEAGGSAISKVLTEIDRSVALNSASLTTWADTAGMSVSQFRDAWGKDAYGTFQKVVQGMGDAQKGGENLNVLLDELGVTNIRTTDTIKRLSSASELMGKTTDTANKAWKENSALSAEAEKKYKTTAAQLQQLKAAFVEIGVELGEEFLPEIKNIVGEVKEFTKTLKNLSPEAKRFIIRLIEIGAIAGPTLIAIGKMSQGAGALAKGFSKITGSLKGISTATTEIGSLGAKLSTVSPIIGIATIGVLGFSAGLYEAYKNAHKERKEIEAMAESHVHAVDKVNASATIAETYRKKLDELIGVENKSNTQKQLMQTYVDKLNESVEGLNLTYDAESDKVIDNTGKTLENTDAIKKQIEAMKERALAEAYTKNATESLEKYAEYTQKISEAEAKRLETKEKIDELTKKGEGLTKAEKNELATLSETYKKLGRDMDGYYEGMSSALVEAQKWNNTLEIQAGALDNLHNIASQAGIKIPSSLEAGIRQGKYTIPSSIEELQALINFDKAVQNAKDKGVEIPENLQAGLLSGELSLSEATKRLNDTVKNGVSDMPSEMNKTGTASANEIISGMDSRKGDISIKAGELTKGAKDAADAEALKSSETGASFGANLSAGINSSYWNVWSAGQSIAIGGQSGADTVKLYNIGVNAGIGFANGIESTIYFAAKAARKIAEQALYSAKQRLDEHSPSREFAKIGKFGGEGFAIGLESTGQDVALASSNLGDIALRNTQTSLNKLKNIKTQIAGIRSTRTAGFALKNQGVTHTTVVPSVNNGITYSQMLELFTMLINVIKDKDYNIVLDTNAVADFTTQRINKNMGIIAERERRQ